MAFIDKKDPVVLNIKLTSKGRELLSEGRLTFKYYAIGDSEIDYGFYNDANYDPFYSNILVPVDKNPNILSFITKELSGDPYNSISTVSSIPTIIENSAPSLGFFNISSGSTNFIIDTDHVKQPDVMVKLDEISGGVQLSLYQAPSYLANVNEPSIGDFILIKWTNKFDSTTGNTGYEININKPQPILIYKILDIASGSLSTNDMIVVVDRDLPNFSVITGGASNIVAGALIYYNYINFTGDTIFNDYSTDYLTESVLTFLENCQCPTITFPFWNLSIIYTEEIVGVQYDDKKFTDFLSKKYGGFVSYIQNQAPVYKKLGVIHYSNSSPSNTYAEQLYTNIPDGKIPTIDLPTIMYHKNSTKTLGLKLRAYGQLKILTGETKSLNTAYYDLADSYDNIMGKVFIDLKMFIIEDPELLLAMSYKSNRSWTLPNYTVGVNDNVSLGCISCMIDFSITSTDPTAIDGSDGTILIYDIINNIPGSELVLTVTGQLYGNIYFGAITGNTVINNLKSDTYFVIINDMGALNCDGKYITLNDPISKLTLYDDITSQSGLDSNFNIRIITPTTINIYREDVGIIYGTLYVGILPYGSGAPVTYSAMVGAYSVFNLTFMGAYTFYVKDAGSNVFIVRKDYVAVGNPLKGDFLISNQLSDTGGTYVLVSGYLGVINPSNNPIIGIIEFSTSLSTSVPLIWKTLPVGSVVGDPMKLYINDPGNYNITIRERYDTIEVFKYSKSKTII